MLLRRPVQNPRVHPAFAGPPTAADCWRQRLKGDAGRRHAAPASWCRSSAAARGGLARATVVAPLTAPAVTHGTSPAANLLIGVQSRPPPSPSPPAAPLTNQRQPAGGATAADRAAAAGGGDGVTAAGVRRDCVAALGGARLLHHCQRVRCLENVFFEALLLIERRKLENAVALLRRRLQIRVAAHAR